MSCFVETMVWLLDINPLDFFGMDVKAHVPVRVEPLPLFSKATRVGWRKCIVFIYCIVFLNGIWYIYIYDTNKCIYTPHSELTQRHANFHGGLESRKKASHDDAHRRPNKLIRNPQDQLLRSANDQIQLFQPPKTIKTGLQTNSWVIELLMVS